MRLIELDPHFLHYAGDGRMIRVRKIRNADGIRFLCPKCFAANNGRIGTHSVICWTPRVADDVQPGPGRWTLKGTGMEDLTIDVAPGKSRSILLLGGCNWHGFVTNGKVTGA